VSDWRQNRILGLTYGEFTWLACGVVLLVYELWAVATRDGDVLTRAWRANAMRWIVLPVGLGILSGHLNGPSLPYFARWSPAIFAAVLAAALTYGIFIRTPLPDVYRMPLFLFGFVVGVLTWSGRP
jgi:hypothetical protein